MLDGAKTYTNQHQYEAKGLERSRLRAAHVIPDPVEISLKTARLPRLSACPSDTHLGALNSLTFQIKIKPEASPETSRVAIGFHDMTRIGVRPRFESVANMQVLASEVRFPEVVDKPHTEMWPSSHPQTIDLAVGCQEISVALLARTILHPSRCTPSSI